MTYNEQKKLIKACTEFLHSCFANGLGGSLTIYKSNATLLILPKSGFSYYHQFYFDIPLEENLKVLENKILEIIDNEFKTEQI